MPPRKCENCHEKNAIIKRPKNGMMVCKECFFELFETEIHDLILSEKMFKRGERIAIGASGGKDSTTLAYILNLLNKKYDYGLDLFLLSIDEGITGYRDESLETVKRNALQYQLPLYILSYEELFHWTMDKIYQYTQGANSCTFCGVFRRQALNEGAFRYKADKVATGHNADDMAETVMLNLLRGDISRLSRCAAAITEGEGDMPRCKPFKLSYQREIVLYAHYRQLDYFSVECTYAPHAFRSYAREYLAKAQLIRPQILLDTIQSSEHFHTDVNTKINKLRKCSRCGCISSQEICQACRLLEGLELGISTAVLGRKGRKKERDAIAEAHKRQETKELQYESSNEISEQTQE
ncbi:hypothetical protein WA158_005578 [Blastocystis sp. Blastoise]